MRLTRGVFFVTKTMQRSLTDDVASDVEADDYDDGTVPQCAIDSDRVHLFLMSQSVKELKSLAAHHKLSITDIKEKQNLVKRLTSHPPLMTSVWKEINGTNLNNTDSKRRHSKRGDPMVGRN